MIVRLIALLTMGCALTLTGCATYTSETADADVGYVTVSQFPNGNGQINPIRLQALQETASTLGARGALAWRSQHIDQSLEQQSASLNQVFDFNQLILNHNVLPPVLAESSGNLTLDDNSTIRMADKTYKIVSAARFVTAPPTWQTYLWMNYPKPDAPDHSLLPNSQEEALVWNSYLKKGWQNGLQQANDIFSANLSRLKRDYLGMVLYRKLLNQRMITAPQVANAELGVTGNANEIRINDQITRITSSSALLPDARQWHPVITDPNTTLQYGH